MKLAMRVIAACALGPGPTGLQAPETDGCARAVLQGGGVPAALRLTRRQASEESLTSDPAIAIAREQVAKARADLRIAAAISD
jgi:outer membrane protein TolC